MKTENRVYHIPNPLMYWAVILTIAVLPWLSIAFPDTTVEIPEMQVVEESYTGFDEILEKIEEIEEAINDLR
jgi:hypothetical protein